MLYIIDIDGTLASIQERLKQAGPEPDRKDKALLQKWLDKLQDEESLALDPPISGVIAMIFALKQMGGHNLVFLTGRSDTYKTVTQRWLKSYQLGNIPLYMRNVKDWRPAHEYKKEQIVKILKIYKPDVCVAVDDEPEGLSQAMYDDLGITLLKVFETSNKLTKNY